MRLNRRVPNGTHGGVRGRGLLSPSYSIVFYDVPVSWGGFYVPNTNWKSTSISGIVTMHSAMLSTL